MLSSLLPHETNRQIPVLTTSQTIPSGVPTTDPAGIEPSSTTAGYNYYTTSWGGNFDAGAESDDDYRWRSGISIGGPGVNYNYNSPEGKTLLRYMVDATNKNAPPIDAIFVRRIFADEIYCSSATPIQS